MSKRQELVSNNIANINTPGFKRSDLDFDAYLKEAVKPNNDINLKTTHSKHIRSLTEENINTFTFTDHQSSARQDGNNVNIDTEMTRLAENSIKFNAVSQYIGKKLSGLKTLIDNIK